MGGIDTAAVPRRLIGLTAVCLAALALGAALAGPASAATRVSYRAFDNQAPRTFFDKGGLQLRGECAPDDQMTVYARSTVDDAMLQGNEQGNANNYLEDLDFDAGAGNQINLTADLGDDGVAGQLVYGRPGGTNVSVDWLAEEEDGYAAARDCVFSGTARFVDSGSSYRANYRVDADDLGTTFFNHGGLKLVGSCTGSHMTVLAQTTASNSMIHANSQYFGDAVDADTNNDFDPGEDFDLAEVAGGTLDSGVGQIIYARLGGTNVTVDFGARYANALGRDCVFNGVARVRSSGDPKRVNFRVPVAPAVGETTKTFFNQGGLKLIGECDSSSDLDVRVSTTSDHAMVHYNGQDPSSATSDFDNYFGTDPNDPFELFGNLSLNNGEEDSSGQIVYSSAGGTNVTVRWAGEEQDGFFDYDCAFVGTAEVATP